jgi:glycosyltransferase involved in cell wall biosynthesis
LYIGTIIRKKGVFELPDILKKVTAQYPEAQLILIGADASDIQTGASSTWELVGQKMKAQNLKNTNYLGKIPYQEVQDYIKKAHVCVFPSFAETLGMVTIESMALQKPVVNTNIGWAQELMQDGKSGFLVHPENHELYAERIIILLKEETTALKMGVESKKYVEQHFDIKNIVEQNIAFYQSIITKN